METHEFRIILANTDEIVDDLTQQKFEELADALYEAGCDDGSVGACNAIVSVVFYREAPSLREAVESAITNIESAGYRVARVESSEQNVFDEINTKLTTT